MMKQKYRCRTILAGMLLCVTSLNLVACTVKDQQNSSSTEALLNQTNKGSRKQIKNIVASRYSNIAIIQSKLNQDNFGTGSFISPNTLITNRHVLTEIEKAENAVVRLVDENGQQVDLPVKSFKIPKDETMDVGIVKLEESIVSNDNFKHITPLNLSDIASMTKVKKGQSIYVVGYPGDKPYGTLWYSQGTIINNEDGFLTMTAPIAGGSSGSPIFNDDNQFIGLVNASTDDEKNPTTFGFLFDVKIRQFIEQNI